MDKKIVIGKIVAPHGVRGDIRILPLTDKPEQFLDLEYLLLPNGKQLTVKHARFHKNMVLVKAEEVSNMNEAELLRNMDVSVYFEDLPALEEGEYYVADMVGMDVVDETGKKIGTFKDASSTGVNDYYIISVPGAKDLIIPALKQYVKEINMEEHRMTVIVPDVVEAE